MTAKAGGTQQVSRFALEQAEENILTQNERGGPQNDPSGHAALLSRKLAEM